jgi:hypothetical protein
LRTTGSTHRRVSRRDPVIAAVPSSAEGCGRMRGICLAASRRDQSARSSVKCGH